MAELLTLQTPVVQTRTTYRLATLNMDWDAATIHIRLVGSDGGEVIRSYEGATATTLMTALNKANLTVKSLQKRVLEQLLADFPELAGAITGTPA